MRRILYIYHVSSIGGGSYCLLNILKELDRTTFEPIVLLRNRGPLIAEIEKLGIKVYTMPNLRTVPYNCSAFTPRKILNAISIIKSYSYYKKLLFEIKPDIVHVNSMMLYPYLRIAKQCGCKTIIHIREHWPEREHTIQRSIAISHIKKFADKIVAINNFSSSMFDGVKQERIVVYDWINLEQRYEYLPLEQIFGERTDSLKIFMFMGGLQEIKGTLEVLQVFNEHKNPNYRLLVLGINPNFTTCGFRGMIKAFLRRIGRSSYSDQVLSIVRKDNRIKCIPSTYNVKHLYEQVYCVLSYFKIPHANLALAESIITNTVNLAAKTEESLEYSDNGKLAILFEENSFESFKTSFKNIEKLHDELKPLLETSSSLIKKQFDATTNSSKLNNLYKRI